MINGIFWGTISSGSKNDYIKTVVFETNYSESGVDEYVDFFLSHTDEASLFGGTRLLEINKLSNIINQTLNRQSFA